MFSLSKLFWMIAQPGNVLVLLLVIGVGCLLVNGRRTRPLGLAMVSIAAIVAVLVTVLPLGAWLAQPLQNRFASDLERLGKVDGIVVLGGGIDTDASKEAGHPELGEAGDRLLTGAELARRFPQARLVYASGASAAADPDFRESDVAGKALRAIGIQQGRIILERDSRNTRENALFAKKLVNPQPNEVWLLVTSAWHMPRAIGVFRDVGWSVHPFPVDVMTEGGWRLTDFTFGGHLDQLDRIAKEWVGLVAYRLAGWTSSLFPGPER